jgi:lysylphosphatidylglycerol synthetase-like protein (DUF2156 family)
VVAPRADSAERERLRGLIARWGHNPVSHLALYGPSSHFWASDDACVAYSVRGTTAIALGDPIAPPDGRDEAVRAFTRYCDDQGWNCAFYQVADSRLYRAQGFTLINVGSDAIVRTDAFGMQGKRRASIRYAVHHCERLGVGFRFLPAPVALQELQEQILDVSGAWLGGKGPELGFSLGSLESLRDPDIKVGLAIDGQGLLHGFVSWLPVPARGAWTLDLMRRRPDGAPGVIEALIAHSIREAAARGIGEVSLGLAPVTLPGAAARLFPRTRSLRQFKAKFDPRWEERFLAASSATAVPEVLFALLLAHLPSASALTLRVRTLLPRGFRPRGRRARLSGA